MRDTLAGALSATRLIAICGSAIALGAAAMAVRAWKRSRITPAEMERRRRADLNAKGKLGDATLVEVRDQLVFYSYDVRGVEYTASQDVSMFADRLPADASVANGVVYVKYDPRNPANSMILSEEWSGFRKHPARNVPSPTAKPRS